MKKGLIATFMVSLMLITVLSAVVTADTISVNKEIEDKNSLYLNVGVDIYRHFMFGAIFNLSIDNNSYRFESDNLWCLRIDIGWGTHGWEFNRDIHHHKGHTIMHYGGFQFRGIMAPNIICGYFHSTRF